MIIMLFFLLQLILVLMLGILFLISFSFVSSITTDLLIQIILSIFLTYFLALFTLIIINKSARVLMRIKEGEIEGFDVIFWAIQETSLDIALTLSKKLFIHSPQPDWLFTLFGFKRRKGVSILTRMWDLDLLNIDENTLIGPQTIVSGHHIRNKKLFRQRIIIGKNCTIGAGCIIGPGVKIGENTNVGYGSTIPPKWILESNALYVGVPVKKIKELDNINDE